MAGIVGARGAVGAGGSPARSSPVLFDARLLRLHDSPTTPSLASARFSVAEFMPVVFPTKNEMVDSRTAHDANPATGRVLFPGNGLPRTAATEMGQCNVLR